MKNGLIEKKGITDEGKKLFGRFLRQAYEAMDLNQVQFAAWLTETTKIKVSTNQITTLAGGRYEKSVALDVYIAIVRSEILRHQDKDKTPYTFEEITAVMCNEYDPFTETAISN